MKGARVSPGVSYIPGAGDFFATLVIDVSCANDTAPFRDQFSNAVPLANVDPLPPGIIQKQLVELRPLDLVRVGALNEWLGYHFTEVDMHRVAARTPLPHTAEFRG